MPVIETLEGGVQVWIANGPAWHRDPKEGQYWVCQLAAGSKPYVDRDGNHQGGATWYENFTDAKAAALKCIEKNKPKPAKRLEDMDEPELAEHFKQIIRMVQERQPDDVIGTMVVSFMENGICQYVSSIAPESAVGGLRELASRIESREVVARNDPALET